MAAAIIPLVATAVGAIAPQIPAIVKFVEGLFGHSSTNGGTQEGANKLQTAVTLLQNSLVALANAGKLPSAPVVDPSLPAGLAGAVQQAVDALKAAGELGAPGTPTPAVKPTPQALTTGTKFSFTGMITPA